jgi:hypothetical protein
MTILSQADDLVIVTSASASLAPAWAFEKSCIGHCVSRLPCVAAVNMSIERYSVWHMGPCLVLSRLEVFKFHCGRCLAPSVYMDRRGSESPGPAGASTRRTRTCPSFPSLARASLRRADIQTERVALGVELNVQAQPHAPKTTPGVESRPVATPIPTTQLLT